MDNMKTYLAYGSNMSFEQMEYRCPDASFIGTGYIEGYELLFKGSLTGSYATIEPQKDSRVPVYIWVISERDEEALDIYEGFPNFYYKKQLPVKTKIGEITGMVYIMHEERKLGIPSGLYYNLLRSGYERYGWDLGILKKALEKSCQVIDNYSVEDIE